MLEKSAELPAQELCCQSCQMELALPGRPQASPLSPVSPSPAGLRIWDPPWDLLPKKKAGRQGGKLTTLGILLFSSCVTLGCLLPTLGPNFPT